MRVNPGGVFVVANSSYPSPPPSNPPPGDTGLQDLLGRINSELARLGLAIPDALVQSYRHQQKTVYGDDIHYLPADLFTLQAGHDLLSHTGDSSLNDLLRDIERKMKELRQQGARQVLMQQYYFSLEKVPLADAEQMLREERIKDYLSRNPEVLPTLGEALQINDPTFTQPEAIEDATQRLTSLMERIGFTDHYGLYQGWLINEKPVQDDILKKIARLQNNAVVSPQPTPNQGQEDVVFDNREDFFRGLKLDGYQHLPDELRFPVNVRQNDDTVIGATLILSPDPQSRTGVRVAFYQDLLITADNTTVIVPDQTILQINPETVHLKNQTDDPGNLIRVGPITWRLQPVGTEGGDALKAALQNPETTVTVTVPKDFMRTPRDLGGNMGPLVAYDWANPDSRRLDMVRTAMNWVKSQPGGNRDLLRVIALEIYQRYRRTGNDPDNAINAVRNFLVSVAESADLNDPLEHDPETGRSRVLDAMYHSMIDVTRTDPRLLEAWLNHISAVHVTNERGEHVGRAVQNDQGEVVEGGYNLQAGIDTIAALAELTNYPEVLAALKNQLSGLLKANMGLGDERHLDLSNEALHKLWPGIDLRGTGLFMADLRGANLRGANLRGANLNRADLTGADLTGANLNRAHLSSAHLTGAHLTGVNLEGAIMAPVTLEEIKSLIREGKFNVLGLGTVIVFEPYANLSRANLSRARLAGYDLTGANLERANLYKAYLRGAYLIRADLTEADLRGADLIRTDLTEADLRGANLSRANLTDANLTGANLTDANLTGANLEGADLRGANLTGANLTGANLTGANLTGAHLTGAHLTGAHLTGADFSGAIGLSPNQIKYIEREGGIVNQPSPSPDPTPPVTNGPMPNDPPPGVVIGGDTILTPEEILQLLRNLGIDPTGIRPDLLNDPKLEALLRELQQTGDQNKARAEIAEWLKLKGVDLTPLGLSQHTGSLNRPDLEMPITDFPGLRPNDRENTASPKPRPPDPILTQALSNLKNSDNPALLMRTWSEARDPKLAALLTFEGLQQVLVYGEGGKLLEGLSQYNLSRFLSAYNTEGVLRRIINDSQVSFTVKASAQKMLSSVQNVLNEARLAPLKSALAELERRPSEDRAALILGWVEDRDPRLLPLLGTEQGLRLVLDVGMGGSFLTALAQGHSEWLRHLNTANLLQKLAQENRDTPLGYAAQNLLTRVYNLLRAATTIPNIPNISKTTAQPNTPAQRGVNPPSLSKVEQPIQATTPPALNNSVQALKQATTPEQRLAAMNGVRANLQELLNHMMNPEEQLEGMSLLQHQAVGLIIENVQKALEWINDPQLKKDAAYIAQGTWEGLVGSLSAVTGAIGFLWSVLRPGGTS